MGSYGGNGVEAGIKLWGWPNAVCARTPACKNGGSRPSLLFRCAILRLALSMFGCRMATELLSARSLLVDQGIALNAQYIDMY